MSDNETKTSKPQATMPEWGIETYRAIMAMERAQFYEEGVIVMDAKGVENLLTLLTISTLPPAPLASTEAHADDVAI